ncbi:MAG: FAD-binding oxidoreductase [Gemmatimonadaceae bacterium]|nr:FAD-binding oxidoreductase [Acetobacteraceae bacterium]
MTHWTKEAMPVTRALETTETDQDLPRRTGVVVIGVSTAQSLAEQGVAVTLVEKGRIAGEQSSRNWGWCRTAGRDTAEIPLAVESVRMWERMAARVGADVGFRRAGVVYVCAIQRDMDGYAAWLETAQTYQVGSRLLDADATANLLPESGRRWAGCLYTPADGRAEPQHAVPKMAIAARRLGVVILEGCAARGLDIAAGRVAGVVTERGTIACDAVVLAGGAWSRLFCGNQGVDFPQLKILGSVMRTAPMAGPDFAVGGADFAFRRRADGGYTIAQRNAMEAAIVPDSIRQFRQFAPALLKQRRELRLQVSPRQFMAEWRTPRRWALDSPSPFEAVRVLDPKPSQANLDAGRANLVQAFPGFADMKVEESWGGMVDVTPDGVPVIGPVPDVAGFYLASGFSGHGFGIGPGAGRLMADLVTGASPVVDPAPFRFERLTASQRMAA